MFLRLKNLFTKTTPPEFSDPELGILTFDCGIWIGSVHQGGRELRFFVAGTEDAPDAALLGCVRDLLSHLPSVEKTAIEFLRRREAELSQVRLDFYSFEFLWETKPDDFAFEFLADGDDSSIWRVEFVSGKPATSGFDD